MKSKGILFIVISAFCFALMNMFVKLSGDIPSIQKSFFRNVVAFFIAFVILIRGGYRFHIDKKNVPLLLGRSICGTIGIIANFYAVDHLVLSDASIIQKLSPFFVIIFSFFLLKEKPTRLEVFSILVAFLGTLLIVKPRFENTQFIAGTIAFVGAMGAGMAYTMVRLLSQKGVKSPQIVLYFSLFSCLFTLPFLIFDFHPMSWQQISFLLLAGLSASGGQFAVTAAYSYAAGKDISLYDYAQVIFAAFLGFIVFHEIPDIISLLGYCLIFGITFLMFIKKRKTC